MPAYPALCFVLVAVLSACDSRSAPADGSADQSLARADGPGVVVDALPADTSASAESPPFCSGETKIEIDGAPLSLSAMWPITGEIVAMGCCDGAALRATGQRANGEWVEIYFAVATACCGRELPVSLDFESPPEGWRVWMSYATCTAPRDCTEIATYEVSGSVDLDGTAFYAPLFLSACVTGIVGEGAGEGIPGVISLSAVDVPVPGVD